MGKIADILIKCKCAKCGKKAYVKYRVTDIDKAANWVRDTLTTGGIQCDKCINKAKEQRNPKPRPKLVTVVGTDGTTYRIPVSDIIDHNREIIDDNIAFGILHECDYTEEDVDAYQRDAIKELREFKRDLNAAKAPVVTIDGVTDLYVMTDKDDGDYID